MHTEIDTKKTPVLALENVSKSFTTPQGVISILEQASFTIYQGEKVAIVGPSGSGKSTLLSLIGLLDKPTSGSVVIDGVSTSSLTENELATLRNERIGFVFQAFELIAPFTVTENITAPLDIAGKKPNQGHIDTLISEVGLQHRRDALPFTLSGGEKQRVAIARALANTPNLILADEPTGSLDRDTGERVLALLLDAVDVHGKTLVVITHDSTVAEKMDRVFEIREKAIHERS
jgi:putative ABC transport system ATP-binding protein